MPPIFIQMAYDYNHAHKHLAVDLPKERKNKQRNRRERETKGVMEVLSIVLISAAYLDPSS